MDRRDGGGGTLVALASYFLLGAGLLAPWNALLTATDYYGLVFPGAHVERTLTLCYLPTCLFFLVATACWPHVFPSVGARVWSSYASFAVLMAALAAAEAFAKPAVGRIAAVTALVGVADGLGQGAVFGGLAASMPASFLHAAVGGTSASGLLICLLRMATKATFPATEKGLRTSVSVYFAVAALISAACVAAHLAVLPRLPVVRRHLEEERARRSREGGSGGLGAAVAAAAAASAAAARQQQDERREWSSGGGGGGPRAAAAAELELSPKERRSVDGSAAPTTAAAADGDAAPLLLLQTPLSSAPLSAPPPTPQQQQQQRYDASAASHPPAPRPARPSRALARRALLPCSALACVYVVSLSIFPGVLGEDLADPKLGGWYPLALFTAYNLGDLLGKVAPLTRWVERRATDAALLGAALSRAVVFFPLYVAARASHAPPWSVGLITLLLGLTNGYLTAALMTLAPRRLARGGGGGGGEEEDDSDSGGGEDAEAIENLLVVALVTGLLLGAMASWLWVV
jgi:equilibrative nucleoside transporter 1/2/3